MAVIIGYGVEAHMVLFAGFNYTAEGLVFCEKVVEDFLNGFLFGDVTEVIVGKRDVLISEISCALHLLYPTYKP